MDPKPWLKPCKFKFFSNKTLNVQVRQDEQFSRFKPSHSQAVQSLVTLVMGQDKFDSLLSLLALSKEICHQKVEMFFTILCDVF